MGSGSAWLLRFCVVPGWWNVGWLVCFCGAVDGTVSCFGFQDDRTGVVFPNSQEQEGMAVAAAQSFALRGILDSGSQRKSCEATKKVRMAQPKRDKVSVQRRQMGAEK